MKAPYVRRPYFRDRRSSSSLHDTCQHECEVPSNETVDSIVSSWCHSVVFATIVSNPSEIDFDLDYFPYAALCVILSSVLTMWPALKDVRLLHCEFVSFE